MAAGADHTAGESLFSVLGLGAVQAAKLLPGTLPVVPDKASYDDIPLRSLILCTARSGSSLLSVALQAYGFDFQEYLNPQGALKKTIKDHNPTNSLELGLALKAAATKNGRMSIKAPPSTLPVMFMIGQFPAEFKRWKFVYLRRQNIVRQAISSVIASRTGQWTHVMKATGSVAENDYSFSAIMNAVNAIGNTNRLIERFIGIFDIDVINVIYEEFLKNREAQLEAIARHLGVDPAAYPDAKSHEPWIQQQATELNALWEERFRREIVETATFETAGAASATA